MSVYKYCSSLRLRKVSIVILQLLEKCERFVLKPQLHHRLYFLECYLRCKSQTDKCLVPCRYLFGAGFKFTAPRVFGGNLAQVCWPFGAKEGGVRWVFEAFLL